MMNKSKTRIHLEYWLSFLIIPFLSIYVSFRNIEFTVKEDIKFQLYKYKKWKRLAKGKPFSGNDNE